MKKAIIGMLVTTLMLAACSSGNGEDQCGNQTELADVELSVAACMAAPDVPIRDLSADSRIACFTKCGTVPAFTDCTQNVNSLIVINPGSDVQALTDFTNTTEFFNRWYCVTNEGRITGFTDNGLNIREIN